MRKKGRIIAALFCYCGRHFGEILVHLFTHVSRQFTNFYNTLCSSMGSIRVLLCFYFCAFLFKKTLHSVHLRHCLVRLLS